MEAGDGALRVLHTPGHAPDHVCFLDEADGTLFCGDLLIQGGTVVVPGSYGGSLTDYLASLARVRELRPARVLPAHGPEIDDVTALIDEIRRPPAPPRRRDPVGVARGAHSTQAAIVRVVYPDLADGACAGRRGRACSRTCSSWKRRAPSGGTTRRGRRSERRCATLPAIGRFDMENPKGYANPGLLIEPSELAGRMLDLGGAAGTGSGVCGEHARPAGPASRRGVRGRSHPRRRAPRSVRAEPGRHRSGAARGLSVDHRAPAHRARRRRRAPGRRLRRSVGHPAPPAPSGFSSSSATRTRGSSTAASGPGKGSGFP